MNKCARCDQTVYPVEGLRCLDKLWHKGCFKCHECNMTLNLKNYKGFEKRPYCNAHCPQAKATTVADTPEIRRLAENTRIQSQAKYHEDFEKSKGKGFTAIADDPETLRIKNTSKIISNAAYHGELERKKQMEEKRGLSGPEEELLSQRLQQQHISGCNSNTNANNNNNNNAKHQNRMSQSQHDQVATNNQQVLQQQQQQLQKPQQQTNYARDPHSYNNHQVQQPQQQQQLNQRLSQQLVAGDNPVHPQQVAAKHMMQQQQRHQLLARQQQQMMLQQQQLIHQQQQQQNRHSMDSSAPMSRLQSQSILTNNPQQQLHQQQQVIKQQQQIMSPNHMLAQQQQHRIKYLPMNDVAIRQIHNPSPNLENHIPHNILAGPSPLMMNPAQLNGGQRILSTPNMMIPNNAHQQQQIIRNYGHQMNNLGPMPKQQQQFIQQAQQPRHMMPHQIPANVNYHHHPMQMQAHLINQQSIQQQHQQHQQQPRRVFRAMYDYVANDVDEVSFFENDILIDCVNVDGNWLIGKVARSGQTGMLPANYVAECG